MTPETRCRQEAVRKTTRGSWALRRAAIRRSSLPWSCRAAASTAATIGGADRARYREGVLRQEERDKNSANSRAKAEGGRKWCRASVDDPSAGASAAGPKSLGLSMQKRRKYSRLRLVAAGHRRSPFAASGVLEIWSATHASHLAGMQWQQMGWIGIGVVADDAAVPPGLPHRSWIRRPILYLIGIIALIAVLAVGHTRFGAKRWLPVLGEFLQVSELVKLIIIVVLARFFSEVRTDRAHPGGFVQGGAADGCSAGPHSVATGSGNGDGSGSGRRWWEPIWRALQWKHALAIVGSGGDDGAGGLAFS